MAFVTRADGRVLGQNLGNDVFFDVRIGVTGADVGASEVCADLDFTGTVQAVDGCDAKNFPDVGQFFKRDEASIGRTNAIPLEVAHRAAVFVGKADPNPHFVPTALKSLDFTSEETLAHLRKQRRRRHAELVSSGLGNDFQFLQAALVVVGDVLQVVPLEHGILDFFGGRCEFVEVVAEERNRDGSSKRRKRREAQVL